MRSARSSSDRANLVFNQSLSLSLLMGAVVFVGVYLVSGPYMHTVAADEATARAGIDYLHWFAPGLGAAVPDGRHVRDVARHRHGEADHDPAGRSACS